VVFSSLLGGGEEKKRAEKGGGGEGRKRRKMATFPTINYCRFEKRGDRLYGNGRGGKKKGKGNSHFLRRG